MRNSCKLTSCVRIRAYEILHEDVYWKDSSMNVINLEQLQTLQITCNCASENLTGSLEQNSIILHRIHEKEVYMHILICIVL